MFGNTRPEVTFVHHYEKHAVVLDKRHRNAKLIAAEKSVAVTE